MSKASAGQITEIYRQQWQIEVFFKFLKQHLSLEQLLSYELKAIETMLYVRLIAAALILVYKKRKWPEQLQDGKREVYRRIGDGNDTVSYHRKRRRYQNSQTTDWLSETLATFRAVMIENRVHWEKDVTLNEDGNGISSGQAPENLSLLKNMALNLARKSGFSSMKEAITAFANKVGLMTNFPSQQKQGRFIPTPACLGRQKNKPRR